ncbi:hypothetical protein PCE1_000002 [Barthelona sp. PCE]
MSNTRFIYFTRGGNTEALAMHMNLQVDDSSIDKLEGNTFENVFCGFLRAGRAAMGNRTEEVELPITDIDENDTLVLLSPIWGGRWPPAVNGALEKIAQLPGNNKVYVVGRCGGSASTNAFDICREKLGEKFVAYLRVSDSDAVDLNTNEFVNDFIHLIQAREIPEDQMLNRS